MRERLRVDAEAFEIDSSRGIFKLAAPGAPDMLGTTQSERERNIAKALATLCAAGARSGLLLEHFFDVVAAERHDLTEQFADAFGHGDGSFLVIRSSFSNAFAVRTHIRLPGALRNG